MQATSLQRQEASDEDLRALLGTYRRQQDELEGALGREAATTPAETHRLMTALVQVGAAEHQPACSMQQADGRVGASGQCSAVAASCKAAACVALLGEALSSEPQPAVRRLISCAREGPAPLPRLLQKMLGNARQSTLLWLLEALDPRQVRYKPAFKPAVLPSH